MRTLNGKLIVQGRDPGILAVTAEASGVRIEILVGRSQEVCDCLSDLFWAVVGLAEREECRAAVAEAQNLVGGCNSE